MLDTSASASSGRWLMGPATSATDRCVRTMLVLLALLGVLAVSHDMPTTSASGIELLPLKLRWAIGRAGLGAGPPFSPLAAEVLARADQGLVTATGRQAAAWLASNGPIHQRLRWSVRLARVDRQRLPLVIGAVDDALASRDCSLLRAAAEAAHTLPARDRDRVAREFARPQFAHWGTQVLRAGLTVSDRPELRRSLRRPRPIRARDVIRCRGADG
jgi:hypothetical protein